MWTVALCRESRSHWRTSQPDSCNFPSFVDSSYHTNSGGGEQAMSLSGSIPSDLKSLKSDDILMPSDGTAQLDRIKQEMVDGVQSMECADSIGGKTRNFVWSSHLETLQFGS